MRAGRSGAAGGSGDGRSHTLATIIAPIAATEAVLRLTSEAGMAHYIIRTFAPWGKGPHWSI